METRSEPLKNVDRDSGLLTSRQLSALFRSTSIIQWFATVRHLNGFWKVRAFWKAEAILLRIDLMVESCFSPSHGKRQIKRNVPFPGPEVAHVK